MKEPWLKYMLWILLAAALLEAPSVKCCVEAERLALLEIKAFLTPYTDIASTRFSTWSSKAHNCCAWDSESIQCNPSGQVTELNLKYTVAFENFIMFNVTLFRPFTQLISLDLSDNSIIGLVESNGSTRLTSLKNLRILKLAGNYFQAGYFSLGAITSLRRLDLNYCNLAEITFPSQDLCKMTDLQDITLSENFLSWKHLSCISNLTSLKLVDLSFNNLTGEIPIQLQRLASLEYLDLSDNYLEGTFFLSSLANLSKLEYLQLSRNRLQVQTEDSMWQPTFQLQKLGLENCSLNKPSGTFPNFLYHQYNLTDIDLSHNNLVGAFPLWLLNNCSHLKALYLMNNHLTGSLQFDSHATFSLEALSISSNDFHGKVPDNIGYVFPQIWMLNMSLNNFEGHIPTSMGQMTKLLFLDLSCNNLSGKLPTQLIRGPNLEVLFLSDNNLEGDIIPVMNLPRLSWLKLSNNSFVGSLNDALRSAGSLDYLDISNNKVSGQLPRWIGELTGMKTLSMSGNFLQGQIPTEICNLSDLNYLDLSENNFTGPIPACSHFEHLYYMHMHNNSLIGGIPNELSNSSSLESLDLRNNQLSGKVPLWINKLSNLTMLLLGGNNLHGLIPEQICELGYLNLLDLSHNKLSGEIPSCIGNMSFGTTTVENYLNQIVPGEVMAAEYLTGLPLYPIDTEVKFLVKNQYLYYRSGNRRLMSGLDLSCNNLTGVIPSELGALVHVNTLNLSGNSIQGHIPQALSNLEQIESLDLSFNNLSGTIPPQLVKLNFLEVFNVSYNNLTGRLPDSGQFFTFDESSYFGNPGLCGSTLNKSCNPADNEVPVPPLPSPSTEDGDRGFEMEDFLWSFSMSCVVMFLATIAILYINAHWREALFEFVDSHILWRFPKFKLTSY